jgi:hypothetical protein
MQPAYERYRSGCRMISILTNLDVPLFDTERVSHIHYASYDLPTMLERLKQEALVQVLVYVARSPDILTPHCSASPTNNSQSRAIRFRRIRAKNGLPRGNHPRKECRLRTVAFPLSP